jgi:hypothetical protein
MRILILAAAVGAVALPASAASAQYWGGHNDRVRQEQRECRRELRRADSRWEYERELRECRREIARARWQQHRRYSSNGYYRDRYDRYDDGYRGRYR